jgi:hypothetical protein
MRFQNAAVLVPDARALRRLETESRGGNSGNPETESRGTTRLIRRGSTGWTDHCLLQVPIKGREDKLMTRFIFNPPNAVRIFLCPTTAALEQGRPALVHPPQRRETVVVGARRCGRKYEQSYQAVCVQKTSHAEHAEMARACCLFTDCLPCQRHGSASSIGVARPSYRRWHCQQHATTTNRGPLPVPPAPRRWPLVYCTSMPR